MLPEIRDGAVRLTLYRSWYRKIELALHDSLEATILWGFQSSFSLPSAVKIGSSWTIEEYMVDEMSKITVLISHVCFLLFQLSKQTNLIYFIGDSYGYDQNVFDWEILNKIKCQVQ